MREEHLGIWPILASDPDLSNNSSWHAAKVETAWFHRQSIRLKPTQSATQFPALARKEKRRVLSVCTGDGCDRQIPASFSEMSKYQGMNPPDPSNYQGFRHNHDKRYELSSRWRKKIRCSSCDAQIKANSAREYRRRGIQSATFTLCVLGMIVIFPMLESSARQQGGKAPIPGMRQGLSAILGKRTPPPSRLRLLLRGGSSNGDESYGEVRPMGDDYRRSPTPEHGWRYLRVSLLYACLKDD